MRPFLASLGAGCTCRSRVRWTRGQEPEGPHLEATQVARSASGHVLKTKPPPPHPGFDFGSTQRRDKGWWGACIPAGLEARGEGGNRAELVEESRGRRLRKKLLSSPHLRDSTRVVFPDPEWPNSFSLILGCRFCVGRSCWMKSPRCVS